MAEPKTIVWIGPPTAVEVWPAEVAPAPLVSERAATGRALSVPLDPEHPTVKGWLAFGLAREAEGMLEPPQQNAAAGDPPADPPSRKERRNG